MDYIVYMQKRKRYLNLMLKFSWLSNKYYFLNSTNYDFSTQLNFFRFHISVLSTATLLMLFVERLCPRFESMTFQWQRSNLSIVRASKDFIELTFFSMTTTLSNKSFRMSISTNAETHAFRLQNPLNFLLDHMLNRIH